jgi:hypothetical protein
VTASYSVRLLRLFHWRVTMSDMKSISIRELHRRTGAWVRSARTPVSEEPPLNVFERWKPLKRLSSTLDRPMGGTLVEDIISHDRDR